MINYADYDFYIDKYHGSMSGQEFNKVILRASYEVNKNIFDRNIDGYEDEVALATCSIADILSKIEKLESKKDSLMSGKSIKIESVGDYSRTFENESITDIEVQISNQRDTIKEELRRYLIKTGLLYRGI